MEENEENTDILGTVYAVKLLVLDEHEVTVVLIAKFYISSV